MSIATTNPNEARASYGEAAILAAAAATGVGRYDDAETAVVDVVSQIAHFCDRLGLDAETTMKHGLMQYQEDSAEAPLCRTILNSSVPLLRNEDEEE